MKVENNTSRVVRSDEFKESHFGVRSNQDLVHIFNVLRNKMYTNKILAVLREYSTNAQDAHIESGKPDLPIVVTLPNTLSPYLKIRDFGKGLSDDDVRNVYAMYGASTKRESNDFNGQLGFGSKAAFSYCDSFNITSYQGGKSISYEAYIDESGLGAVAEVFRADTHEPDGILITVPVKEGDIGNFHNTAADFYPYFTPTPELINFSRGLTKKEYVYEGADWALENRSGYYNTRMNAIMGNVCYPIDTLAIQNNAPRNEWQHVQSLFNTCLDMHFPIGDLSIAATREGLEYDKKTVRSIVKKLLQIKGELEQYLLSAFDDCNDIVEARLTYAKLSKSVFYSLRRALNIHNFDWNGFSISSSEFSIPQEVRKQGFTACSITEDSSLKSGLRKVNYWGGQGHTKTHFSIGENVALVINDATDRWQRRCAALLENSKYKTLMVFTFPTPTLFDEFKKATGIDDKYFINLKDWEPAALPARKRTYNKKANAKCFRLVDHNKSIRVLSGCWEEADVDIKNDSGVYVPINKYRVVFNGLEHHPHCLKETLRILAFWGVDVESQLVGFKAKVVKEKIVNDPSWRSLESIMQDLVKSKTSSEELQQFVAWNKVKREFFNSGNNSFFTECYWNELEKFQNQNSETVKLLRIAKQCETLRNKKDREIKDINFILSLLCDQEGCNTSIKKTQQALEEMKALVAAHDSRYPLIKYSLVAKKDHVIDYINAIELLYNQGDAK